MEDEELFEELPATETEEVEETSTSETEVKEEKEGEKSDTSDQSQLSDKLNVDGEEFTGEQLADIVRSKRDLEKENAKLAKQHKEIQKLATRKGVKTEEIAEVTGETDVPKEDGEEDEFASLDAERDRRYLTKKVGVVTKAEIQTMREEIRKEMREEIRNRDSVMSVAQEIDAAVKEAPFADKQEVLDYMHFKSSQRDANDRPIYVSPSQAIERLYPEQFKKTPKPIALPSTDTSTHGVSEPTPKQVGFDDPQGMQRALEDILFAGEVA